MFATYSTVQDRKSFYYTALLRRLLADDSISVDVVDGELNITASSAEEAETVKARLEEVLYSSNNLQLALNLQLHTVKKFGDEVEGAPEPVAEPIPDYDIPEASAEAVVEFFNNVFGKIAFKRVLSPEKLFDEDATVEDGIVSSSLEDAEDIAEHWESFIRYCFSYMQGRSITDIRNAFLKGSEFLPKPEKLLDKDWLMSKGKLQGLMLQCFGMDRIKRSEDEPEQIQVYFNYGRLLPKLFPPRIKIKSVVAATAVPSATTANANGSEGTAVGGATVASTSAEGVVAPEGAAVASASAEATPTQLQLSEKEFLEYLKNITEHDVLFDVVKEPKGTEVLEGAAAAGSDAQPTYVAIPILLDYEEAVIKPPLFRLHIDVSDSMFDYKQALCGQVSRFLDDLHAYYSAAEENFDPDSVAVELLFFGGFVYEPIKMALADLSKLKMTVGSQSFCDGGTDLYGAVAATVKSVVDKRTTEEYQFVNILFTDGSDNRGHSKDMMREIERLEKSAIPRPSFLVFGFGDVETVTLTRIAGYFGSSYTALTRLTDFSDMLKALAPEMRTARRVVDFFTAVAGESQRHQVPVFDGMGVQGANLAIRIPVGEDLNMRYLGGNLHGRLVAAGKIPEANACTQVNIYVADALRIYSDARTKAATRKLQLTEIKSRVQELRDAHKQDGVLTDYIDEVLGDLEKCLRELSLLVTSPRHSTVSLHALRTRSAVIPQADVATTLATLVENASQKEIRRIAMQNQ